MPPSTASIVPSGSASAIRRPRRTTSSSASSRASTPAAVSAVSSPSEWPAAAPGSRPAALPARRATRRRSRAARSGWTRRRARRGPRRRARGSARAGRVRGSRRGRACRAPDCPARGTARQVVRCRSRESLPVPKPRRERRHTLRPTAPPGRGVGAHQGSRRERTSTAPGNGADGTTRIGCGARTRRGTSNPGIEGVGSVAGGASRKRVARFRAYGTATCHAAPARADRWRESGRIRPSTRHACRLDSLVGGQLDTRPARPPGPSLKCEPLTFAEAPAPADAAGRSPARDRDPARVERRREAHGAGRRRRPSRCGSRLPCARAARPRTCTSRCAVVAVDATRRWIDRSERSGQDSAVAAPGAVRRSGRGAAPSAPPRRGFAPAACDTARRCAP